MSTTEIKKQKRGPKEQWYNRTLSCYLMQEGGQQSLISQEEYLHFTKEKA